MSPRTHGGLPGPGVGSEVRSSLSRSLGDVNMQDRGLGLGKAKDGKLAGKANAVWAKVAVNADSALTDFEVRHKLAAVPVVCRLERVECPLDEDVQASATATRMDRWTTTTCRVAITVHSGSLDGATLTFYVGGE